MYTFPQEKDTSGFATMGNVLELPEVRNLS